jgi:hypothetical protein
MSLDFIVEVWDALRSHIDLNDRTDAADSLINLLIDNNYEPTDIKDAFSGEKEVLSALKDYLEQHDIEDDVDDYYDEDIDDEWN